MLSAATAESNMLYRTSDRPAPHNVYISEEEHQDGRERTATAPIMRMIVTGHYKFAADDETIVPDEGTATVIRPGLFCEQAPV